MRVEIESPTALARGRAENDLAKWTSENNKAGKKVQALTDDLEAVADFYDDLRDQMRHAWAMTPGQFARLERGMAAFGAFARLYERRAA
jgi:hypothetical protein